LEGILRHTLPKRLNTEEHVFVYSVYVPYSLQCMKVVRLL